MCDIERDPTSNFDWTIWTGDTPSLDTGPSKAFNGAYYFYMEASAPRVDGEAAELVTILLALSTCTCTCRLSCKGAKKTIRYKQQNY